MRSAFTEPWDSPSGRCREDLVSALVTIPPLLAYVPLTVTA